MIDRVRQTEAHKKLKHTNRYIDRLTDPEGEHPLAIRMLSGCQQPVNKLSREKLDFAQTNFLESTNQNTNVNTKFLKIKTDESFRVAVKRLSGSCQEAVGQKSSQF